MVLKSLRCVCFHCSSLVGSKSNEYKVGKALGYGKRKTRLEYMHNVMRNKAGKQVRGLERSDSKSNTTPSYLPT